LGSGRFGTFVVAFLVLDGDAEVEEPVADVADAEEDVDDDDVGLLPPFPRPGGDEDLPLADLLPLPLISGYQCRGPHKNISKENESVYPHGRLGSFLASYTIISQDCYAKEGVLAERDRQV